MSFWAKVGVDITDLEVFKEACRRRGLHFNTHTMNIESDSKEIMYAKLVHNPDVKTYSLHMDIDAKYSKFARLYGSSGEKLLVTYSEILIEQAALKSGAYIQRKVTNPDGSVVLSVVGW